jgi:AcrR family transcriptional regulator
MAALRMEAEGAGGSVRRRLELAALEASGEHGYRQLAVRAVLERGRVSRARFYREFRDKADCYASGYALVIDGLAEDLLHPVQEGSDWQAGFAAALAELGRFIAAEPDLAKGLLAEVHVAGGAAGVKRKEVFERLSRAIDRARRETSASRHSPPPITAAFILCAIEAAVMRTFLLEEPEGFAADVPALNYIAVRYYFGEAEAQGAYSRARRACRRR